MTARKMLLLAIPITVLSVIIGLACTGWRPGSAVNGGREDPAIRDVERVGGVCRRVSDVRRGEPVPGYAKEVKGDPVVEVDLCRGGTRVTDEALAQFHLLSEVRWLWLHNAAVTDAGLKHLAPLRKLRRLGLFKTRVTDAGLKELATFADLLELRLGSTAVTDAGMKDVARLRSLTELSLDWTKVGDAGLAELTALPHLVCLGLWDAPITDAGVEHLTRIQTLSNLGLAGTAVTDAGVKNLVKLPRLRFLSLNKAKVTLRGAKELRRALPDCGVYLDTTHVKERSAEVPLASRLTRSAPPPRRRTTRRRARPRPRARRPSARHGEDEPHRLVLALHVDVQVQAGLIPGLHDPQVVPPGEDDVGP
jgi:hypothetical protein